MSVTAIPKLAFDLRSAERATEAWGFNCGPASLCAVTGFKPEQVRPHLGDFEEKRYTNPSLIADALRSLKVPFRRRYECLGAVTPHLTDYADGWPQLGLVRIQWSGPWTKPGVPVRVRYRKTHWIAVAHREGRRGVAYRGVFDINAIASGGWITFVEWVSEMVPWILKQCVPKADGAFWPTHCWEIER